MHKVYYYNDYVKKTVNEVQTPAQLATAVRKIRLELSTMLPKNASRRCVCGRRDGEYDPCICPTEYSENYQYIERTACLKALLELSFCSKCERKAEPSYSFCPSCASPISSSQGTHANCPDWDPKKKYCASCGQPAIRDDLS